MKRSLLYDNRTSLLDNQSLLKPKGKGSKKELAATLILTSLVDVFSILVIYLMVSTTAGVEMDVAEGITLPSASNSVVTTETGFLVMVSPRGIEIDKQIVPLDQVMEVLKQHQAALAEQNDPKAKRLVLQADKESDFDAINPVIMAGTQSGFENITFAVLQKEEKN
ncbi:MAG: biopolymer transporter ExbD [Bdellovibrionales bacterium]|nr:biopolymer transporter ExbD [Bdellovibrionales bacterium]